jgi:hypothetical protein
MQPLPWPFPVEGRRSPWHARADQPKSSKVKRPKWDDKRKIGDGI